MINLSIKELNELIYSLGTTATKGMLCDKELNASLLDKLYDELNRKIQLEDEYREIVDNLIAEEPEFDSAGFSTEDRYPTHECWCGSYETCDCISEPHDNRSSHFVSNEEADEDAKQNSRFNGVSQKILDFVEENGVASFATLNEFYRKYTNGSNSLSHILTALQIPYKNRPTRRYLVKPKHGLYVVKVATPQNWVVSDYDYKTFNEAPYGDN